MIRPIVSPPDILGPLALADSLRRNLFDACQVVRILERLPGCDDRRKAAIESERERAVDFEFRLRLANARLARAITDGVLDNSSLISR